MLGTKRPPADYPIDHYQQQQSPLAHQLVQDDFFVANHRLHRPGAFAPGHPMHPPPPPPHHHHMQPNPLVLPPTHMMTTQLPRAQTHQMQFPLSQAPAADSIPSASSLDDGTRSALNMTPSQQAPSQQAPSQQAPYQQQQHQQPVYYTPPIFAYNNNLAPSVEPPPAYAHHHQLRQPPVGVPEVPLSVDEYNARQARLRPASQQLAPAPAPHEQAQRRPQPVASNLLADPVAQQRHRQQMLDRQLLLGGAPPADPSPGANQSAHYPDPVVYRDQQPLRAPYAHPLAAAERSQQHEAAGPQLGGATRPAVGRAAPPAAAGGRQLAAERLGQAPPPQQVAPAARSPAPAGLPACARQQVHLLEGANSSAQTPVLFCNEDLEYPTREVMRALEAYAAERSIEQLLPQQLIQMLVQPNAKSQPLAELQLQLALDPLQADQSPLAAAPGAAHQLVPAEERAGQRQAPGLFSSASYEPMCRALVFMAQPRRARSLAGQWKVVVNLPGHKYRGIAVSQMVRVEECSRPNGECAAGSPAPQSGAGGAQPAAGLPRSRCLQQYENQRLLAWSHQQGLHLDIFRVPAACSCHIRRL